MKETTFRSIRANTMRFEVPPGKYIIVPQTESDDDLDFLLRVFSEMPANLRLIEDEQLPTTESWEDFWDDGDDKLIP